MRRLVSLAAVLVIGLLAFVPLHATGPMGFYGVIEKVVFEPSEAAAERVQVWGAFAYYDGGAPTGTTISAPKKGFLYFSLPAAIQNNQPTAADIAIRREWMDLKSVAATNQAVAFGSWLYIGGFG